MTADVKVRPAVNADAPAVRELTRAAYAKWVSLIGREPLPMRADHAAAIRDHIVHVAERQGTIIALVETIPATDHLLIENIAVLPLAQGKGLGDLMLRHAEALAQSLGKPEVRLYTNEKFTDNIRFYAARGYHISHRETLIPGSTAVFMAKRLRH